MKISTHALVSVSLLVAMAAVLHQIILFHILKVLPLKRILGAMK